jgi:hypothetical protein
MKPDQLTKEDVKIAQKHPINFSAEARDFAIILEAQVHRGQRLFAGSINQLSDVWVRGLPLGHKFG